MLDSSIVLFAFAGLLGYFAHRKGLAVGAVKAAIEQFLALMPRIMVALIVAGFVGKLMPSEPIARAMGPESGLWGILLASVLGGFVPSGPIISFPLVVVFRNAGAGWPQVAAFLTAWSVFAFHRVMIFETTLMGWRFVLTRLSVSLILPPLCGILTAMLCNLFGVR